MSDDSELKPGHPQADDQDPISRRDFLNLAGAAAVLGLASTVLPACGPTPPGYSVGRFMAIQSVQDFAGSIPLVAGKRTLVRAFPVTTLSQADGITGTMSVLGSDGSVLATVAPLNGPISSRPSSAVDSDQPDHALDFELPWRFTGVGSIQVRCDLTTTGTPAYTASLTQTLTFVSTRSEAAVAPVLVEATAYGAPAPTLADFHEAMSGAIRRLPVPETHFVLRSPTAWATNRAMTSSDDFMWIATDMALHFFNVFGSDFPAGVVQAPPTVPSPYTDGMYNPVAAGAVLVFSQGSFISLDETQGTFGHEFSHHYGLGHAGGCLTPADVDPSLPMTTDLTGMDVADHRILPRGTSELMSYCSFPRWPSSTTYNRVLAQLT